MFELKVEKRDPNQDIQIIREKGNIPAVFYGSDVESTPVTVSGDEFKSVWKKAGGSSLISLKGLGEEKESVIQELDIDPVTSQVRHIDFYVIKRGQVMETVVPFEFVGESPAVKNLGGILVKVMRELNINVLPKDLPQQIEVDISSLDQLDSQIAVKDLKLPEGVEATDDPDEIVVAISEAQSEPVEESAEEMDIADVEIEQKGKKEEEGADESGDRKSED